MYVTFSRIFSYNGLFYSGFSESKNESLDPCKLKSIEDENKSGTSNAVMLNVKPTMKKALANPSYEYRTDPIIGPRISPVPWTASKYPTSASLLSG